MSPLRGEIADPIDLEPTVELVPAPFTPGLMRAPLDRTKPALTGGFVQSSGRFDRSVASWAVSVARLRGLARVVAITGTEASGRSKGDDRQALAGAEHWPYVHLDGPRGVDECWATWDDRAHHLAGTPYARKLTTRTYIRSQEYGGGETAPVHALVVPLAVTNRPYRRRKYLIVWHAPLDNTPLRADIWRDCSEGLQDVVAEIRETDPAAEPVIVGDHNKNWRLPGERAMIDRWIAKPLGLVQSWRKGRIPARGGTHGQQIIDGHILAAKALVSCELVADDASSDHRPMRTLIRSRLVPTRWRRP